MFFREIFRQDFKLYHSAHQSHIQYIVDVPEDVESIHIHFNYGPILEKEVNALRRALNKEGLSPDQLEEDEGFRNLLTLSVNDSKGFRGAHHYFNDQQEIILSDKDSSLGFIDREVMAGRYEIIVSAHGLFSDFIEGSIRVEIETAKQHQPKQTIVLPRLEKKEQAKERPLVKQPKTYKVELHAHTTHSDASQTAQQLIERAEAEEIDWLAVTDHNTTTGIEEILENNYISKLKLIPGMEYTTFYGHFLVHGELPHLEYNWSEVGRFNLDHILQQLKEEKVNITIAHPYDSGNPYCTGCRFDYQLESLENVDSLEIWNSPNPTQSKSNQQAYLRWVNLLSEGHEIAATAGRDWHGDTSGETIAFNYVTAEEDAKLEDMLLSLNLGRSYVSLGPTFNKLVINDQYHLGARLAERVDSVVVDIEIEGAPTGTQLLIYNEFDLKEIIQLEQETIHFEIPVKGDRLIRFELREENHNLLTATNPIYFA